MLAASAWLIWVLASIQGVDAVLWILVAATSLAMLLWIYGCFVQMGRAGLLSWIAMVILAAVVVMSLRAMATPGPVSVASPMSSPAASGGASVTSSSSTVITKDSAAAIVWQPWAPGLAEQAAAQGKTVFVDFTANWCISCQANKVRVLQSDAIAAAFARHQVVALRADWTRRDALIANELARHGRSGVPLYLVYSKKGGAPKVLSEWLTESEVLSAIQ